MTNQKKHPLIFDCINCGRQNIYPKYMFASNAKPAVKTVVKKCIYCGFDNQLTLPDGFDAGRTGDVTRGLDE